jgi:hypothetical protein
VLKLLENLDTKKPPKKEVLNVESFHIRKNGGARATGNGNSQNEKKIRFENF